MQEAASHTPAEFDLSQIKAKERFYLLEYIKDFNAARAALAVGYSESTAYKKAAGWVGKSRDCSTKPALYDALYSILDARARACWVDAQSILDELAIVGFADIGDYVSVDKKGKVKIKSFEEIDSKARRAISMVKSRPGKFGITVELKMHDKIAALVKSGQHLGLFTDKLEMTGAEGGPLEISWAE